jgi:hypothetical protein
MINITNDPIMKKYSSSHFVTFLAETILTYFSGLNSTYHLHNIFSILSIYIGIITQFLSTDSTIFEDNYQTQMKHSSKSHFLRINPELDNFIFFN